MGTLQNVTTGEMRPGFVCQPRGKASAVLSGAHTWKDDVSSRRIGAAEVRGEVGEPAPGFFPGLERERQ